MNQNQATDKPKSKATDHGSQLEGNVSVAKPGTKKFQMSNAKIPGWLDYLGDYTTHLYRDYNKPLKGSPLANQMICATPHTPQTQRPPQTPPHPGLASPGSSNVDHLPAGEKVR